MNNPEYLEFIREQRCIICHSSPCEPHHVDTGGVGMKCSDYLTVPLCWTHHKEIHRIGKQTFVEKHRINLYHCISQLMVRWLRIQESLKGE